MSATTNFLQWDPNQTNQESDSAYAGDPARTGGAVNGDEFDAATANKLFYQLSTMVAALGTMLAQKGYTNSDANFNQLVAVLSNIQTSADIKPALLVIPYGPTQTFDCSKANGFQTELSGNVTSTSVVNVSPGQIVTFIIIQNETGGHTFAWPTSGMLGTTPIESTATSRNVQTFIGATDGTLSPIGPMTSTH
jgi:hypothetical protein